MSNDKTADAYRNNRVGPVLRASSITAGVIEAAQEDNPGKEIRVDDKIAYVVSGPADRDRLEQVTKTIYEQVDTGSRKS